MCTYAYGDESNALTFEYLEQSHSLTSENFDIEFSCYLRKNCKEEKYTETKREY